GRRTPPPGRGTGCELGADRGRRGSIRPARAAHGRPGARVRPPRGAGRHLRAGGVPPVPRRPRPLRPHLPPTQRGGPLTAGMLHLLSTGTIRPLGRMRGASNETLLTTVTGSETPDGQIGRAHV